MCMQCICTCIHVHVCSSADANFKGANMCTCIYIPCTMYIHVHVCSVPTQALTVVVDIGDYHRVGLLVA